ncbi:MAG: DNA repair protein RadC [Acidobacteria bacterium]|nr:DNA repair protein RadC [Acidobacteriota bacterium]
MKDLPAVDRPREKLTRAGPAALGDTELVALVLGSGTKRWDALAVARAVLVASGGADGLTRLSLDELRRVEGVGVARAARLQAAVELGRRALVRQAGERPRFHSPEEAARYLLPLHGGHRVERFGVLLLDTRNRLIRATVVSIGAPDASLAQPREVFREALLASAACVILFHNHPSGDPTPSQDDVAVTARLVQVGQTMGIPVADHIILGAGRYYSFKLGNLLT